MTIDRAAISGPDGCTHHGIYEIGFLNNLPNLLICQPRNGTVLKEILNNAFSYQKPICIRYPNISAIENKSLAINRQIKAEILEKGKDLLIIPLGHMYQTAFDVKKIIFNQTNISATIVDPVFIKPLDKDIFSELLQTHTHVITIEEHALNSGFGSIFNSFVIEQGYNLKIINFGIPDKYIQHGKREDLLKEIDLDSESIAKKTMKEFNLKSKLCRVKL